MGYAVSGGGDGTSSFFDMRTRLVCWNPAAQAAITSISLIPPTGGFNVNCYFSLHGLGEEAGMAPLNGVYRGPCGV